MTNQELLLEVLKSKIKNSKIGIVVRGLDEVLNVENIKLLSKFVDKKLYLVVCGYEIENIDTEVYCISNQIEKAVLWRSIPKLAGSIIIFVKSETGKMHSLEDLDSISSRDLAKHIVTIEKEKASNGPQKQFWEALLSNVDFYGLQSMKSFVDTVNQNINDTTVIPQSLWILNLLPDYDILNSKEKPSERLEKNRELVKQMGQLSDDARKRISSSLSSAQVNKEQLKRSYRILQNFFKYGNQKLLKQLDFNTVKELLTGGKKGKSPVVKPPKPITGRDVPITLGPIIFRPGGNRGTGIIDLSEKIKGVLGGEEDNDDTKIINGKDELEGLKVEVSLKKSEFRKLIGNVCHSEAWGGLLKTDEKVLKDAVYSTSINVQVFNPASIANSALLSFNSQSLLNILKEFDNLAKNGDLILEDELCPIFESIIASRAKLLDNLDFIWFLNCNKKLHTFWK